MNTQLMVKPSSLMPQGIKMVEFGNIYLFRFTDDLQSRMEELLERKKLDLLSADEIPELAGIIELSRIFTLINAQLSTQAKWCLENRAFSFDATVIDVQKTVVRHQHLSVDIILESPDRETITQLRDAWKSRNPQILGENNRLEPSTFLDFNLTAQQF